MASATAEQRALNIQSPPWTAEEDAMFEHYPDKLPAKAQSTIAELTGRSERAVNQRYHILKRRKRDEEEGVPVRRSYNRKTYNDDVYATPLASTPEPAPAKEPVVIQISKSEEFHREPSASLVQALAPAHKQPQQQQEIKTRRYSHRSNGWTEEEDAMIRPYLKHMSEEVIAELMEKTGRTFTALRSRWSKLRNDIWSQESTNSVSSPRAMSLDDIVAHTGDIQELQVTRLEKELLEKIATVVYQVNGKLFTLKVVG